MKGFYFEKKAKRELDKIISELLINDRDVSREELSGFCPERLEIAKIDNPETKNQRKFNGRGLCEVRIFGDENMNRSTLHRASQNQSYTRFLLTI